MTIDAALALISKYLKIAASFMLVAVLVLILLKLLGINVWPIAMAGYHERAIILAVIAYAIK
jgi:hypothetical protein